jgi:hypothetical protein
MLDLRRQAPQHRSSCPLWCPYYCLPLFGSSSSFSSAIGLRVTTGTFALRVPDIT